MKFNSKSVTVNGGTNLKVNVEIPSLLHCYQLSPPVWDESLEEFNKELDTRRQVSEIIDGVKVDVLRLKRVSNEVFIWMTAKEKDIDKVKDIRFTIKGKLVFEDDKSDKVEKILIKDLLYGNSPTEQSIFRK
jgi:hypothetical protein